MTGLPQHGSAQHQRGVTATPVSANRHRQNSTLSRVSAADASVGIPMRCVFALTAMGFLPQSSEAVDADEIVRVRMLRAWLRIDARFGSVYRRRGDPALVLR